MFPIFWTILWSVCWAATVVAGVLSVRSRRAMHVGRAAVGVLMLLGGAVFNLVQLVSGSDYSGFAEQAHFRWVTGSWEAVVVPNHVVLIALLVVFEATVGVLVLSGGRRTRLGYLGAIAFHLALWLFSWFLTVYCLLMLPALLLLLRAERRAASAPGAHPDAKPQAGVGP
ncbi:MAG TPA: hypothetical protein VD813_07380 [Pseudonocardia sp.]|nr:hypothetical protein [Pseudonocardia sp.]